MKYPSVIQSSLEDLYTSASSELSCTFTFNSTSSSHTLSS